MRPGTLRQASKIIYSVPGEDAENQPYIYYDGGSMGVVQTNASALRIRLGVPDQRLRNGKLIVKSARIGQVAVNEA